MKFSKQSTKDWNESLTCTYTNFEGTFEKLSLSVSDMPKQFTLCVTNLIIDIVKEVRRSMMINFERRDLFQ